jgi:hypothetical protein
MSLPRLFRMAVEFAVQCRVKHLVLYHLSPRYRPIKVRRFVIQVFCTKYEIEIGKRSVLLMDNVLMLIQLYILVPIRIRVLILP